MQEVTAAATPRNCKSASACSIETAQVAPSKKPRIEVGLLNDAGNITVTLTFDGRDAWALDQLITAGPAGCTPIDNPAPRWSHYVWKLRRAGVVIETHDEPHGGAYAGHHARYELRSKLVVLESSFADGRQP